jgi:hypothetical protein
VPQNILEAELLDRIKRAILEDLSQRSMTTIGLGHNRGPPFESEPPVYDIRVFCDAHKISRSSLYNSWQAGTGPRFFRVGTSIRISREAAAQWRREREAATVQRFGDDGEAA